MFISAGQRELLRNEEITPRSLRYGMTGILAAKECKTNSGPWVDVAKQVAANAD